MGESTYVLKTGAGGAGSQGVLNEARCLRSFSDRVVDLYDGPQGAALLLRFVQGTPLSFAKPGSATAVGSELAELHDLGLVFCDLTPANIMQDGDRIALIDWEFCCAEGSDIATMTRRPYSSGFTHPDLVWGRGVTRTELDTFALDRMQSLGFLR